MTYRWDKERLEQILEALQSKGYTYTGYDKEFCDEIKGMIIGMELTNQKYVYIKGQPDY